MVSPKTRPGVWSRPGVAPLASAFGMGLIALTATSLNTEQVVTGGFERAIASLPKAGSAVSPSHSEDGAAGSEDFWLRQPARLDPSSAAVLSAVTVGQHLTLSNNGTERNLVITQVSDSGEPVTHIQTGPALLLTCREGGTGKEVRLRMQNGMIVELPGTAAPAQRTL